MKKMRINHWLFIMGLGVATLFATSCEENVDLEGPADEDIDLAETDLVVEASFDEVEDIAFAGIFATSELGGRVEEDGRFACATVSANETETGWVVTIDFGTEGCEGPDGRVRTGVITITHDGQIWQYGSKITIALTDYVVNGHLIEGTRTIENKTTETSEGVIHEITLQNGKVTFPDETFATREVVRTRTWVRNSTNPSLDEVWIEGSANGINRNGRMYEVQITQKIVFKRNCRASQVFIPVSGVKEITSGDRVMTIDFGDGTCDRFATVTLNGRSKVVSLRNL